MRHLMFATLAAASLLTGCCGSVFRICDGPCGGGAGGCDPCSWHPGKHLFQAAGCASGCGDYYWSDWHSQPPDCCDPCDRCGNFAGQYFDGNPCRGCGNKCGNSCGTGWGGEFTGGHSGGAGCGCSGGGGGMDGESMVPTPQGGDVIYETGAVQRRTPSRMTPTPITPANPTRATATRVKPSQAAAPRPRYNTATTMARQPVQQQRRVRPASHESTSNSSWEAETIVEPQANAAPAGKPCTTCRR